MEAASKQVRLRYGDVGDGDALPARLVEEMAKQHAAGHRIEKRVVGGKSRAHRPHGLRKPECGNDVLKRVRRQRRKLAAGQPERVDPGAKALKGGGRAEDRALRSDVVGGT